MSPAGTSPRPTFRRRTDLPADHRRILLVDDSATSHMLVGMILNQTSYELLSARDGQEGVEVAVAERPDLILMDVVMPRMDGFEATRQLRSRDETRAVPVIMLTTRSEARNVEQGFQSGCTDYITKPIDSAELLRKIRHLVEDGSL